MKDEDFEKNMDSWIAHEVESAPELRPTQEIYRMVKEKKNKNLFPIFARRILVGFAAFCLLLAVVILPIVINLAEHKTIIASRTGYKADENVIVKNMPGRVGKKGPRMATLPLRQLMFQYQKAESELIYGIDLRFPMREKISFNTEDNYRFLIQPNADHYVYVFQLDSSEKMIRLFPNNIYSDKQNPLKQEKSYYVPSEPNWIYLTGKTGEESIYIIASTKPISELDDLYDQYVKARFRDKKQENLLLLLKQIEDIGKHQKEANKWIFIFKNNSAK